MSKQSEINELMLAMEQLLISNLDASITDHGQAVDNDYQADFTAHIDGKTYNIMIVQEEENE